MERHTILYRFSRTDFDAVARAYYRAPQFRLAAPVAAEALDVGEHPLDLLWPLSNYTLPGLPHAWHVRVRVAYSAAWTDLHRKGPWASTLTEAVAGGRPLAHVHERPGTGATFFSARYARRFDGGLAGSGPHAAPVRDALNALRDEIRVQQADQGAVNARYAAFEHDAKATFNALGRLDVLGVIGNGASLLSRFATASQDLALPAGPRPDLTKAVDFIAQSLAALDAWDASNASARLDALRQFYGQAKAEQQYVLIERAPQPGAPSRTRRRSEGNG